MSGGARLRSSHSLRFWMRGPFHLGQRLGRQSISINIKLTALNQPVVERLSRGVAFSVSFTRCVTSSDWVAIADHDLCRHSDPLNRAADVLWCKRFKWLAYPWIVLLVVAALMLISYREPKGAYRTSRSRLMSDTSFDKSPSLLKLNAIENWRQS